MHLAEAVNRQGGLYTLIERSAKGDVSEVLESLVRAHPGSDVEQFVADVASPLTAVVTLTITEGGYRTTPDGSPDLADPAVRADIERLVALSDGHESARSGLSTALGRLVAGLDMRRRAGGGPMTILSCDNLPGNGEHAARAIRALARTLPETADWCERNVAFASSSVDRITPRLSAEEATRLAERYGDAVPVVAEPFSDWVISGDFPAGRPQWESAGARFTADLEPWEARKLWLLNGAHTILAGLGRLRGHEFVSQAVDDPVCRRAVEDFWDEAQRHLPVELGVDDYRRALLKRFENPAIAHALAQISMDSTTKMRLRIAPVAEREREAGREASGCAFAVAVWLAADAAMTDAHNAVAQISPRLAADPAFVTSVSSFLNSLRQGLLPHAGS